MLDIKTLEGWLWDAACKIRGPVDAPKYKDFILPLIFLKRLSDVFNEERERETWSRRRKSVIAYIFFFYKAYPGGILK